METKRRSIIKIVSWQTIGLFVTLAIVNYYTEEFLASIKIAITGIIASSFAFYLHERVWNQIGWGKK